MSRVLLSLPVLAMAWSLHFFSPAEPSSYAVVELFTSQGCSSCPPADEVLRELNERAERTGEAIYALSFHVDYWNYLGWADPFSSPYYSARQRDYTDRLQARTYTPQLVINGRAEMIGSRRSEVIFAVEKALRAPVAEASVRGEFEQAGQQLEVTYQAKGGVAGLAITALVVQDEARSSVERGENRGRELSHVRVVRAMKTVAAQPSGQLGLTVPQEVEDYAVLLLLQEPDGGPIIGVVELR